MPRRIFANSERIGDRLVQGLVVSEHRRNNREILERM
jgi:hypothetical protein